MCSAYIITLNISIKSLGEVFLQGLLSFCMLVKMTKPKSQLKSPCVNVCLLNVEDVCVGCYRTGKEISQWGSMNKASQQAVMKKVREREAKSQFVSD